jgi:hypothetical protein
VITGGHLFGDPASDDADNQHAKKADTRGRKFPLTKDWEGKPDKAKLLSPNPGRGD